ncbi:MAG: hypothetical protein JST10_14915 [Bacteroidetes bacterium]|nr:hypothetical protein [Bacteroidota bacterium]
MTRRNTIWFATLGIAIIALMPYLFTRNALYESLNFTNTGNIGDTIGGITAPFLSLLGAILVYLSFQEQVKANAIVNRTRDEDLEIIIADKLLTRIETAIKDLSSYKIESKNIAMRHNPETDPLIRGEGLSNLISYVVQHVENIKTRIGVENEKANITWIIGKLNTNTGLLQLFSLLNLMMYAEENFERLPDRVQENYKSILRLTYLSYLQAPLGEYFGYFHNTKYIQDEYKVQLELINKTQSAVEKSLILAIN